MALKVVTRYFGEAIANETAQHADYLTEITINAGSTFEPNQAEYGIFREGATLDTIGVDPSYQNKGIGEQLINEFVDHLRKVGVQKINTLVDWNDSKLIHSFSANQFSPSKTINLERSL